MKDKRWSNYFCISNLPKRLSLYIYTKKEISFNWNFLQNASHKLFKHV